MCPKGSLLVSAGPFIYKVDNYNSIYTNTCLKKEALLLHVPHNKACSSSIFAFTFTLLLEDLGRKAQLSCSLTDSGNFLFLYDAYMCTLDVLFKTHDDLKI